MSAKTLSVVTALALLAGTAAANATQLELTDDQLDQVVAGNPFGISLGGLNQVVIGGPSFVLGFFGGLLGGGGSQEPPPVDNGGNGGNGNGSPPTVISDSASQFFSQSFDGGPGSIVSPGTNSFATLSLD